MQMQILQKELKNIQKSLLILQFIHSLFGKIESIRKTYDKEINKEYVDLLDLIYDERKVLMVFYHLIRRTFYQKKEKKLLNN